MKKLIVALSLILSFGFAAQAEYLFWQLSDTAKDGTGKSIGDFSYAAIFAESPETQLKLADETGASTDYTVATVDKSAPQQIVINLDQLSNASGYSYYIEYYNWNGASFDQVGTSGKQTYSELASNGAIYTGSAMEAITDIAGLKMWTGSSYVAATPEPTGGLLVMLGMALIGLKRKRV